MLITKRLTRDSAERLYIVAVNQTGAALSAGYLVCWNTTNINSASGYIVEKPITSALPAFAGVVEDTINDAAHGLVQVYGYNEKAYLRFESTGGVVAEGQLFGPVTGQWYAQSNGQSFAMGPIVNMSRFAANTFEGQAKVFIRAL